jgi:hypothetical protein
VKPLIPDSQVVNKRQDMPWKKRERDKALDLFFRGTHPSRIAIKLQRNPKAVERLIQEYRYNERNKAVRYEPRRRLSRRGLPMTQNEWMFVKSHRKRGLAPEVTARILQRADGEVLVHQLIQKFPIKKEAARIESQIKFNFAKTVAPSLDQLLAHHYLYHCAKCPVISDKDYDCAKAEEIEFGCGREAIEKAAGYRKVIEYPPHIRSLAYYLQYKFMEASGKWQTSRLPYEMLLYAESQHPEIKKKK